MAVDQDYIRLNHFRRPSSYWGVVAPEKATPIEKPFAYDLSVNALSKGEVTDYKAINASITMIVLSVRGEHIFRPYIGSSIATSVFENYTPAKNQALLKALTEEIEAVETRIKVLDARAYVDPDNHTMTLNIPYMVLETGELAEYNQKLAM